MLHPEGIKGKVIAREQRTYLDGVTERPNPYAEYVTTVLAERGTIVQGRPLGGRVFIETQDNYLPTVAFKSRGASNRVAFTVGGAEYSNEELMKYINGEPETDPNRRSNWAYDSRRVRETMAWTQSSSYVGDVRYYTDIPYVEVSDLPEGAAVIKPRYVGMNTRGLRWLGVKPEEEFGSVKTYAEVTQVNIKANHPEVAVVKHLTVGAQPAEARIEFRRPVGLDDPDVTVNVTPVRINVVGGTYQRIVKADVATVTVTGTHSEQVAGSGEDHIVYLRSENMTFYLGDD